jgi:hypothetical protein
MTDRRVRRIVAATSVAVILSAGGLACGDDDGDEVPNVDDTIEEGVDDLEESVEDGADRLEEGADRLEEETDREREDG